MAGCLPQIIFKREYHCLLKNLRELPGRQRHPSDTMAKKSLFCMVGSEAQASEIVNQLKDSGFSNNDISALLPDKTGTKDFAHEHHTKAPEGATAGASTGGIIGGALGWLAGIGVLAIPGLGPFIAAGPIMAALSGAAVGAAVLGIAGALVGMGIPEYEAKRYEGKIKDGNILISVHLENGDWEERARHILQGCGAGDVAITSEVQVKTSEQKPITT